jgi:hypothetical protein
MLSVANKPIMVSVVMLSVMVPSNCNSLVPWAAREQLGLFLLVVQPRRQGQHRLEITKEA